MVPRRLKSSAANTVAASVATAGSLVLGLATFFGVSTDEARAQQSFKGRYCEWFAVPLPREAKTFKAYTLSRDGLLFVATRSTVFVRDPAETDGWRTIFTLPVRKNSLEDHIAEIGVAPYSSGLVREAVYVLSDFGAWAIPWQRASIDGAAWSGLRYRFEPIALQRPDALNPARLHALSTPPSFGLIADSSGDIASITAKDTPRIAITDHLVNGRVSLFANGIAGTTITWGYASNTAAILDTGGHRISSLAVPGPDPTDGRTIIHEIATLAGRNVIAVASSRGLFIGRLNSNTGALLGDLMPVKSLADHDLSWVGSFLGRIAVAGSGLNVAGHEGVLAIEVASGDPGDLAGLAFEVPPGGPAAADTVRPMASDLLLIADSRKIYEFHPNGWSSLNDQSGLLSDLSLFDAASSPAGISVFADLLSTRLYGCRAPPNEWNVYELPAVATPAHIVPDPSGLGAWLIEQPPSGVGGDGGYIRFLSAHGYSNTTDGVVYGAQHRLARVRLVGHEGSVSWPEGSQGGILLPMGGHFLWGNGGRWRRLSLPDGTPPLSDLTPTGQSGDGGLLGIAAGLPHHVVRLDVAGPPLYPNSLKLEPTRVSCRTEQSRLIPDNERHIWLACLTGKTWRFDRVHPIAEDPDLTLTLDDLPEPPVSLLKMETDGWVLTESGVASIGGGAWSKFADGATTEKSSLLSQALAQTRSTAAGNWHRLWRNEDGGEITAAYEVLPAPSPGSDISDALILTRTRQPLQTNWSPGPAFLLDTSGSEPAVTRYSKAGEALLWTEPTHTGEQRYDISSDGSGGYLRYQGTSGLAIPGLSYAAAAARFRNIDFSESSRTELPDYTIVASADRAAVRLDPTIELSDSVHAIVPLGLTYRDYKGIDQHVAFDSPLPADPLPAPDGPVSVLFTAAPDDWWRAGLPPIRLRPDTGSPFVELLNGLASLRPHPGQPSLFEFEIQKRDGSWVNEFRGLPIEFAAPPIPARLPGWAITLLVLCGLVITVGVSRRVQEHILILLGRRWTIRIGDVDHIVEVRAEDNRRVLIRTGGQTPIAANPKLTFDTTEPINLPYAKPGETIRLGIEGKDLFIETPWPRRIGSRWSVGADALIAGQIAVLEMTGAEARFAENGVPVKRIRFAALGYTPPKRVRLGKEGRVYDPLWALEDELQVVKKIFAAWGADTCINSKADRAALCAALREQDVVHVAAHAEHDCIYLSDESVFTTADLETLEPTDLRCQLLVLSVCHVGRISDANASLAFQFVKRGVNVIASTEPLDDFLAKLFFGDLYSAWLPDRRSGTIALATAIRKAGEALRASDGTPRAALEVLLLYGDPTLHLEFS